LFYYNEINAITRKMEYGETLNLTPDQKILFTDGRHGFLYFEPVRYKNNLKGFQINNVIINPNRGFITNTMYIVLGDTPIQINEDDVEMIMENGEWKRIRGEEQQITSTNSWRIFTKSYWTKQRETGTYQIPCQLLCCLFVFSFVAVGWILKSIWPNR